LRKKQAKSITHDRPTLPSHVQRQLSLIPISVFPDKALDYCVFNARNWGLASLPKWQLKKPSLQNKSQWVNSILGHNPVHPNEINSWIWASLQTSLGSRILALNYPKIKAWSGTTAVIEKEKLHHSGLAMIVSEIGWPEQLPQFGDFLGGLSSSAQKASHCSTDKTK
jgi:hypothetical protein